MGRLKVPYLVAKRNRNGTTRYYWQPSRDLRAAGFLTMRLSDVLAEAIAAAVKYNDELRRWREQGDHQAVVPGTMKWLIQQYQHSSVYNDLRQSTRRYYDLTLSQIEAWAGDKPIEAVTRRAVLAKFEAILAENKAQPPLRKAREFVSICRVLLRFATDNGALKVNPLFDMRLKTMRPRKQRWTQEQVHQFVDQAHASSRPSLAIAVLLAWHTGLRQGDVLTLAWNHYDGKRITRTQSKTGREVSIPVSHELRSALEHHKRTRTSPVVVVSEVTGRPYTSAAFVKAFRLVARKSGLPEEIKNEDLRRSAASSLAIAGATGPELAAWMGWSIKNSQHIIDTYVPQSRELADNAGRKRDKMQQELDANHKKELDA